MRQRLFIAGTDTGVGKTAVLTALVSALRQRGETVWVHKPAATGPADEDAATLAALADPTQPPGSACPHWFPEPAAPPVAAAAAGGVITAAILRQGLERVWQAPGWLLVEGVGGLLAPLADGPGQDDRADLTDLVAHRPAPVLIVTRPHLGTLNHTRLVLEALGRRQQVCAGVVINHHQPDLTGVAVATVGQQLGRWSTAPLLAEVHHRSDPLATGQQLLRALGPPMLPVRQGDASS